MPPVLALQISRRWASKPTPSVPLLYMYVLLFAMASGDWSPPSLCVADTFSFILIHLAPSEASIPVNILVPFSGVSFPGNVAKSMWPLPGALKYASSLGPQQQPVSTGSQLSKWLKFGLSLVPQCLPSTPHSFSFQDRHLYFGNSVSRHAFHPQISKASLTSLNLNHAKRA